MCSMAVPMMNIRKVWMTMRHRLMAMPVRVRLAQIPFKVMRVPVMQIVPMRMGMGQRFVAVPVFVAFGQVQPHAGRHEARSCPECA